MPRFLVSLACLLMALHGTGRAQIVEFHGLPTVDEVLSTLMPERPGSAQPTPRGGGGTPRTLRDPGTNADLMTGSVPSAAGSQPPVPPPPRPVGQAAVSGSGSQPPPVTGITQPTEFAIGSAALPPAVQGMLTVLALAMKQEPGLRIMITGHTDTVGGPAVNDPLSTRRALAAMSFLLAQGIAADRLAIMGWGDRMPLPGRSPHDTINRRIQYVRITGAP